MKLFLSALVLIFLTLDGYALLPEKTHPYHPEQFYLSKYQQLQLRTADGHSLAGWLFRPQGGASRATIVIAYGDAGNMSYSLYYVSQLIDAGYTVITFDYRGFGKSDSFRIDTDYLYYNEFANDLLAAETYAREHSPGKKVGVMAFSMGTIITTIASRSFRPDFIVADNFVASPEKARDRIRALKGSEVRLPDHQEQYAGLLAALRCPALLITGTEDQVTTLDDANELIAAKNGSWKLLSYKGRHGEALKGLTVKQPGDLYFSEVKKFIQEAL